MSETLKALDRVISVGKGVIIVGAIGTAALVINQFVKDPIKIILNLLLNIWETIRKIFDGFFNDVIKFFGGTPVNETPGGRNSS